jgi:ribosomal protein L40E
VPFCIKCGNELLPGAKFCHRCGSEAMIVKKPEKPAAPSPYRSPTAEMYYEMLRPAAEERVRKPSVRHREAVAKPFAGGEEE